ncbi:MAG: hypothetical protein ACRDFX_05050, partial [Chloroflexota bacterium]
MHVRKGAMRNGLFVLFALLLALALPLLSSVANPATPAAAQSINPLQPNFPPSSISSAAGNGLCTTSTTAIDPACYVSAVPSAAFNVVGSPHTVTFQCGAGVEGVDPATYAVPGTPPNPNPPNFGLVPIPPYPATALAGSDANAANGVIPGCYDVTASVTDETGGAAPSFTTARCGKNASIITGSTVNCAAYASPLCPAGLETSAVAPPGPGGSAYCNVVDPTYLASAAGPPYTGSQLSVTINPGAPHAYVITFTGYTPLLNSCVTPSAGPAAAGGTAISNATTGTCFTNAAGTSTGPACPSGFTYQPGPPNGFNLSTNLFVAPFEAPLNAPDGACQFTVAAEKKYYEITSLTLTSSPSPCGGTLTYSEGLKAFFGPSCLVTATATGSVILKTGVNCATEPANGTPAAADFPAGSTYQCSGDTLSVTIPKIGSSSAPGPGAAGPIAITFNGTGVAFFGQLPTPTLGGL